MKAWQLSSHGAPENVLELVDRAEPAPTDGQVRIAVEAVPLNFADELLCRGRYQVKPDLPFTPGVEVIGRVCPAGAHSSDAAPPGTRVLTSAWLPNGGLAEYALARVQDVHAIPEALAAERCTVLGIPYQTAYLGLARRCALRAGETLLVHAAAGGTGSAALQLGKAWGARVIATAGGPEKTALCREMGADIAIDYRSEDFVARVLDATDGLGADVVFDPVGGDTLDRSLRCTAWEGRVAVVGFASGAIPDLAANRIMLRNISIVGVYIGEYALREPALRKEMLDALAELCLAGRIEARIHAVVDFEDAPAALAALAGRKTTGRVVVRGPDASIPNNV